ncbi:MAG: DUF6134 family protein [Roseococcus sp.]|nr:DUF6134 family protein [Roseococcus sp.]
MASFSLPPPRRALLALAAAAPSLARAERPRDYRWRVMREGRPIGTHDVTFTRQGARLSAVSEVSVAPRVLGVVVYRYEHRYTEVTEAGRFLSVVSRLNRNGRVVEVSAEAIPGGVCVRGPEGELRLPPEAAPLSWWEPQRFGGAVPIFGTSTGRPMQLSWTREARPGGGLRWRTAGEIEAVLDYDAAGRWVGYAVKGDDGSTVSYEPA